MQIPHSITYSTLAPIQLLPPIHHICFCVSLTYYQVLVRVCTILTSECIGINQYIITLISARFIGGMILLRHYHPVIGWVSMA